MDKLSKEEIRKKYKEEMLHSMKFEDNEDVYNYEQSVYKLMDKGNPECIYDLVEGFSDDYEYIGITDIVNDVIDQLGQGYNNKVFVHVLVHAVMKMKGKTDENAEMLVYTLVMRDEYFKEYLSVVKCLCKDERSYHIELLNNNREDNKKYGYEEEFEIRAVKLLEVMG